MAFSFTLQPNCCHIAVAGATGGVGRILVSRLLRGGKKVRALVRDKKSAQIVLPSEVDICEIGNLFDANAHAISKALHKANVLAICTGTTAFPTNAWRNGNTPQAVDATGVHNLLRGLDDNFIQRIVYISSIGTKRTNKWPFNVLNLFGTLNAKQQGEMFVKEAAKQFNCAHAIIRPGRLVGEPHTNVGMLRSDDDSVQQNVCLYPGDQGLGDVSRAAVAEAVYATICSSSTANYDFSVIQTTGEWPNASVWEEKLRHVQVSEDINVSHA